MQGDGIFITADGSHSIFSEEYGFSYHSKHGAIQETRHVFIDAALRFKAVLQQEIAVLDIGFGTGLNAFMTLLEAKKRNLIVNYIGVEKFPISIDQATQLNYSHLLEDADPTLFNQLHELDWEKEYPMTHHFQFTKLKKDFRELDYQEQFDIIYFDAFAPTAQPELWDHDMLTKMHQALKTNGILTTYCAKGDVKRTLKAIGFVVEKLKGPPGKREMTRATKV